MKKYFIIGAIVIILAAILGFVVLKNQTNQQSTSQVGQEQAPLTTTLPPSSSSAVTNGSSKSEADNKADDERRAGDMNLIYNSIAIYRAEVKNPVLCGDRNKIYRSDKGTDAVDGTGWLPIDFTRMSPLPFTKLPKDPTNSGSLVYSYACDGDPIKLGFELNFKYSETNTNDVAARDGGDNPNIVELGFPLTLIR